MICESGRRWLRPQKEGAAAGTRSPWVTRARPKPYRESWPQAIAGVASGQDSEVSAFYRCERHDEESSPPPARLSLDSRAPFSPLANGARHPREGPREDLLCLPGP